MTTPNTKSIVHLLNEMMSAAYIMLCDFEIEYRSVTSRYHGHDLSGSKQRTIGTNMAAISITALTSFFSGEPKSV